MPLVRLIYVSTVKPNLVLSELSAVAKANNKRHDLSGLLAFDSKYFIQVIEGGRRNVSNLLANLVRDERHADLELLEFDYIEKRQFGQWSMQFVPLDKSIKEIIFTHSVGTTFNPYNFTQQGALSFLMDLRTAGSSPK
jgi:hypothetical protein